MPRGTTATACGAAERCAAARRRCARRARAWLVGGAVRDRLLGRRRRDDVDLVVDGTTARRRRDGSRAPAARPRVPAVGRRSAPGASSARTDAGRSTSPRCGAARIEADLAAARLHRQRDGRAARRRRRSSTPPAARADLAARPAARWSSRERVRGRPAARRCGSRGCLRAGLRGRAGDRRGRAPPRRPGSRASRRSGSSPSSSASSRAPRPLAACELMDALGAAPRACCPSSTRCSGVEQNRLPPPRRLRPHARGARAPRSRSSATPAPSSATSTPRPCAALLAEPLADGLTRGEALRFGALLHDAAKPPTRAVCPRAASASCGHDAAGADAVARDRSAACGPASACARTSPRSPATTCALGFLVHQRPADRARRLPLPARHARRSRST